MSTARAWDAVEATGADRATVLAELNSRISGMQRRTLGTGAAAPVLPVPSALSSLFPGGGLKPGAVYAISSPALALLLMAEVSKRGDWTAVVGIPDFSAEAAEVAGIRLDRLILVPHPGPQAVRVAAALADVMSVVVIGRSGRPASGEAERLEARLRRTGSALLSLDGWPGAESRLRIASRDWRGLASGRGHLEGCRVTVTAQGRDGRGRRVSFELPEMSEAPAPIEHITE